MSKIRTIGMRVDYETRSRVPIKSGAYKYAECPDFAVLVIAYSPLRRHPGGAIKMGRPVAIDMNNPAQFGQFKRRLVDTSFQKHAFNANFERITSSRLLGMGDGEYLDPQNWHCTAIKANVNGIFGTLDEVAQALRSPVRKDPEGRRLIKLFTVPDKKTDRFHRFVLPGEPFEGRHCWCGFDHEHDSRAFDSYCVNDVLTEAVVANVLPDIPADIQAQYEADQRINDRGFRHFKTLSEQAVAQVQAHKTYVMDTLRANTGIDNPNSGPQFHVWLEEQGYPMDNLTKDSRAEALRDPMIPDHVADALRLRGQAGLTSVTKHKAALNTRCNDGRIRGSLQFYGAHTGREAGRGIQPQNLPKAEATKADRIALVSGNLPPERAPEVAKGTVRSSIVPARGHVFVAVDYNAIEARCLGWQCGETWVNEEFSVGQGKIYEATAEKMFGVDKQALLRDLKVCDKCGNCDACAIRAKGKVGELALGYAGGAGALVTMGAEAAGIDCGNYVDLHHAWAEAGYPGKFWQWNAELHDYPELLRMRDLYREARPMTVRFWKLCARAWDLASQGRGAKFGAHNNIIIMRDGRHNRLILPSGRSIWYRFATSHPSDTNPEYIDRRTFIGKAKGVGHVRTDTHGGKLTENITQAVARDVLFDLIMRIEAETAAGWPARLVLHVHDEVVLEVPVKHADQVLADTQGMMATPPSWAPDLAVKGEGDIMERYRK